MRWSIVGMTWLALLASPRMGVSTEGATATVKGANDSFRRLLLKVERGSPAEDEQVAQLNREMRQFFDIQDLTRRAMRRHWDEMGEARQIDLVDTLRKLIERNYVTRLRSNLEYEVEYTGEEDRGDDVVVSTMIKARRRGRPVEIKVDYVMHRDGDAWRVWDVITDDVSVVRNYRSQFNRIISRDGIEGLLERMKRRLQQMEGSPN